MSGSKYKENMLTDPGFTIIEIMVTVGVLVLIAAGVSAIFTSVSTTVNSGKRVAELNRYAAQFERVMREDFEGMSRDGSLVIVHQYAQGDNPGGASLDRDVQLSPADGSDSDANGDRGRPRRIDEIMFFAQGNFETSRRVVSPGMVARSDQAAIYYGHGQRRRPDLTRPFSNPSNSRNKFFVPVTDDDNIDRGGAENAWLGTTPLDGIPNPNQYAVDWTLLRHVTLLVNPQTSGQDLPDEVFGVTRVDDRYWLEDSGRQVALQPAMQSIFGSLNFYKSTPDLPKWYREYIAGGVASTADIEVFRASGLVDIVTTDLSEIEMVLRYGPGDTEWLGSPLDYPPNPGFEDFQSNLDLGPGAPVVIDPQEWADPLSPIAQQRLWMLDALPSLWDLSTTEQRSRVRYESVPTRLLFDEDAFANDRERVYAEADQEMLGSSVFIPECTEFIVEWSNGYIDKSITNPADPGYKKVLWYGLPRGIDSDGNGQIDPGELSYADRYTARDPAGLTVDQINSEKWLSHLIMGHDESTIRDTEMSMFAYQYTNPDVADDSNTPNTDESIVQWPWPKFIRISLTIADPTDKSIEQSFQMIFEVPSASVN